MIRVFFSNGQYACVSKELGVFEAVATAMTNAVIRWRVPAAKVVEVTVDEDPMETKARLRGVGTW